MAFTQEAKDKGHAVLDSAANRIRNLAAMANQGGIEACKLGNATPDSALAPEYFAARDDLYKAEAELLTAVASLMRAKGILGGVTGPGVAQKSVTMSTAEDGGEGGGGGGGK